MNAPPLCLAALLPCLLAGCRTAAHVAEETFRESFTFFDSEKNLWIAAYVDREEDVRLTCSLEGDSRREGSRVYRLVYDVQRVEDLFLSAAEDGDGDRLPTAKYLLGPVTPAGTLAAISVALPAGYLDDHRETGFEILLTGDRESEARVIVSAAVIDGFLIRCDYEEEQYEPRTRRRRRR
jgi:hypothetical protein